jgi:hypothetical protein
MRESNIKLDTIISLIIIVIMIIGVAVGLFILSSTCNASIDIYYPDNSTTEVWVANETNPEYDYYINNSIPDANYTSMILRNQINNSVNLIEDPITFVNTFTKIFYAVVFCFAIVMLAYIFKKVIL